MKALLNEWGLLLLIAFILHWQESGENPAVFCYRIGVRLSACVHRGPMLPEEPPKG